MGQHYDWRRLGAGRHYQKANKRSAWEQALGLLRAYYERWQRGRK